MSPKDAELRSKFGSQHAVTEFLHHKASVEAYAITVGVRYCSQTSCWNMWTRSHDVGSAGR